MGNLNDVLYCTHTNTLLFIQGYYCPNGTEYSTQYPCPEGTYRNDSMGQNVDDCYLCPPGQYCDNGANTEPDGPCTAGHFCVLGSATATPQDYDQFLSGQSHISCHNVLLLLLHM